MVRVGIWGITGYSGYELARWLQRHPEAEIIAAVSQSHAGKRLADVVPGPLDLPLIADSEVVWADLDLIFTALPHGIAARAAAQALAHGVRVIDLSADLRLDTPNTYEQWYTSQHPHPELLDAPYGLPELNRANLVDVQAIANPGCYPTSVMLGLAPLFQQHLVQPTAPIIINSASGVSGAGRGIKQHLHFVEANENFSAYAVGHVHRHVGEIEQELSKLANQPIRVIFAPHLLPVLRGILSTMYIQIAAQTTMEQIWQVYTDTYRNEDFVRVLPQGSLPSLSHVVHTNMCAIGLTLAQPGLLIVHSAIDNLLKGAAGQAIQNMNIMYGFAETLGLA